MSDSLLDVSANQPQAYVRDMDTDVLLPSSWFVMRSAEKTSSCVYFI
jgi:hypothetical protein